MKVLLVNPPAKFLINDEVFPPLGLLYLSSYLKERGYGDITLLDLNGIHTVPDEIDADVVGFYSTTPQFPTVLNLKKRLKERNKNRSAIYIIGGSHVSGSPGDAEACFDYVIRGEGEKALFAIVDGIRPKDKIIKYDYMKDIDTIPFPDRDIIDIKRYKYLIDGKQATSLITSRGCPYGCAFCANNAWGKTLRLRSPENVIEEIKLLMKKYGYKAFMFFDDTMTVNRKRMAILCDMLQKLKIIYRCFIRSDTVDKDILLKMKQSGCVEVGVGLESGSPRILKIVNKGETVEQNMKAVKWCKEVGIRIKGFFVVGFPGENRESIQETINFIEESQVDDLDVTIFTPYPGSKIYEQQDRYDIHFLKGAYKWYKGKPGQYKTSVSTSGLTSQEILDARNYIEKRFKPQ